MNTIYTISIVACTTTGNERRLYALAGRHVHPISAARRFESVEDAVAYADRHGYTVTARP
jgi:hypothetical protein